MYHKYGMEDLQPSEFNTDVNATVLHENIELNANAQELNKQTEAK